MHIEEARYLIYFVLTQIESKPAPMYVFVLFELKTTKQPFRAKLLDSVVLPNGAESTDEVRRWYKERGKWK